MNPEAMLRGLLHNAAARQHAHRRGGAARDSVDWLVGYDEGRTEGTLEGLALAMVAITGESITDVMHDARAQAAMDAEFPFTLWVDGAA